jgi:hypothetical protein
MLAAGADWRYPLLDDAGEVVGFREYGWPALVWQVWQSLASMRHVCWRMLTDADGC